MKLTPRLLLYPFAILFCSIAKTRNYLYSKGVFKSHSYNIPLVSIGNLTVGGTGKTPLTEYLIKQLSSHYSIALLSRGYGRKTKGPLLADQKSSPASIGDEPMQMKLKFPGLTVAVAEKRILGMDKLLSLSSPPQVVLLDDAFQHRAIQPGLSILVTDYYRPIYKDLCLPAGNLREPVSGKSRAQIIVVNKCPENLSIEERDNILKKLAPLPGQKVFFSSVDYKTPRKLNNSESDSSFSEIISKPHTSIVAVAGIGNPSPFFEKVRNYNCDIKPIAFPDHHDFTHANMNKIANATKKAGSNTIILTTEKDAVRLKHAPVDSHLSAKIWYIPIELKILFNQQNTFNKTVEDYVSTNQRNS